MRSIVLSASKGFSIGVIAFLNSFEFYHKDSDITIFLLNLDLGDEFLQKHVLHRPYVEVIPLDWEEHAGKRNTAWSTKIPRFRFASSELSGVVMVCDADMFFCRNIEMYFEIAEAGFVVGGANGSNFYFGEPYSAKWGKPINRFWPKTIGSVPTWMDVGKYGHIWRDLYDSKAGGKDFCDFELVNILLIEHVPLDKILVLPAQQVTGLHHFQLRPDTRVIERRGQLVTSDGLEVLMVHGKWWQDNWLNGIMATMKRYCESQRGGNERCLKGAKDSWQLLKSEFEKWLNQ